MKVLLTGATGFVGAALRDKLLGEGHEVRLLVRRESEHKIPAPHSFDIVYGNVFETNTCLHACDGQDAVINLIGIVREIPTHGVMFDEYHRVATKNLVDAAQREGVSRFIQMSALGTRDNATSYYHRSKFAGEQIVRNSSMRWTIFRPSAIFGRGDHLTPQIVDLVRKPVVPLVEDGKSLLQPVSIDDVVACFTQALSMPETQGKIYELGGPDRVSFKDILLSVSSTLGEKSRLVNFPVWLIRPIAGVMQRFASFPITVDQLRMLLEDNVCEIDRYVKTFRIEPKSYVQALPGLLR